MKVLPSFNSIGTLVALALCFGAATSQAAPCDEILDEVLKDPVFQAQLQTNPKSGTKTYWFHYNSESLGPQTDDYFLAYFSADPVELFPWGSHLTVVKLLRPQRGKPYAGRTQELSTSDILSNGNRIIAQLEITGIPELKEVIARIDTALKRESRDLVLARSRSTAKDMDLRLFFRPGPIRERIVEVINSWKATTDLENEIKRTTLESLAR